MSSGVADQLAGDRAVDVPNAGDAPASPEVASRRRRILTIAITPAADHRAVGVTAGTIRSTAPAAAHRPTTAARGPAAAST